MEQAEILEYSVEYLKLIQSKGMKHPEGTPLRKYISWNCQTKTQFLLIVRYAILFVFDHCSKTDAYC
jgi:hypothetical protein